VDKNTEHAFVSFPVTLRFKWIKPLKVISTDTGERLGTNSAIFLSLFLLVCKGNALPLKVKILHYTIAQRTSQ